MWINYLFLRLNVWTNKKIDFKCQYKIELKFDDCRCLHIWIILLFDYDSTLFVVVYQVCTLVSWDSSVHDSIHLNRVTPNNERVYLIIKVVVQLSHPAAMELILRKRICINVYKKQSIAEKLRRKIGKMVS